MPRVLALVLFLIPSLSIAATPREKIIHIAVIDDVAITKRAVNRVQKIISNENPGTELISIRAYVPHQTLSADASAAAWRSVRDQVEAVSFADGSRVRMLVIESHGRTGTSVTTLEHLGSFDPFGPDPRLERLLHPLKGNMLADGRVVLLGCKTLAGEEWNSDGRAVGFLNYLGAVRGSFFGLTTPGFERPAWLTVERALLAGAGGLGTGFGAAAYPIYVGNLNQAAVLMYSVAAGAAVIIWAALAGASTYRFRSQVRRGEINSGNLLTTHAGEIVERQRLSAVVNDEKILNCAFELSEGLLSQK